MKDKGNLLSLSHTHNYLAATNKHMMMVVNDDDYSKPHFEEHHLSMEKFHCSSGGMSHRSI